jgi:lipid II:glycine glycyltransferase (peptidoglycan interpeptide bridge formation enzyme)
MVDIVLATEADRQAWNDFVARTPAFALMQSYEWGEFKESLGWKVIRLAAHQRGQLTALAQLFIKSVPLGLFSVGYVPRGPLIDWRDQATTTALLSALHDEARRHRAVFTKIEPPLLSSPEAHGWLRRVGFRASSYTNQPRATIIVDLTQDLDDILKQMRKKTRQYIRRAARMGVTVRVGSREDLPAFYELMQATGRRAGFPARILEYYEREWQTFADSGQAVLLMAFYRDHLLAVRTVYRLGSHAAEFHAGSSDQFVDLRPNHVLVWEALKWAKAQGCRTYDLWGIPDQVGQAVDEGQAPPVSDRTDGLWGVYRFKRGFGRTVVCYTGAYDYVYSAPLYALLSNKLFGGDRLDRVAVWMDWLRQS